MSGLASRSAMSSCGHVTPSHQTVHFVGAAQVQAPHPDGAEQAVAQLTGDVVATASA